MITAQEVESLSEKAEQGDAEAQFIIGNVYQCGTVVEENDAKAIYWYTQAAEQGHSVAQFILGHNYYNGEIIEQDLDKSVYWFKKGAEHGEAKAQYAIACLYYKGEGVEQDTEKALFWLVKSARQFNFFAIEALIKLNRRDDVPDDIYDLYVKKKTLIVDDYKRKRAQKERERIEGDGDVI